MGTTEEALNFEREPEPVEAQKPGYHDVTVTVLDSWVKKLWRADGFINRMLDSLSVLGGKVRTVAEGPIRDPESEYERGMRAGRRHYVNGDSHPREPNGEKRLLQWILGVLSALVVLAIAGGVTLYGEFTALKATVTTGMSAHEQRLNRLEADRDQRFRGGANAQSP